MNCLNSSLVEGEAGANLEVGARAGAGVEARDTAGIGVWVSLPLVRAPLASLFLPLGRRLR